MESDRPAWRLLINLFFANELWFTSVRPFSNGPFWSLGYEFWYYLLFAAAVYVKGQVRPLLISLLCVLAGPKILMLFPIWLLGVVVYRRSRMALPPEWVGWLLTLGTMVAYLVFHLTNCPDRLLALTREWFGQSFVNDQLKWSGPFLSDYAIGTLVALHFHGVTAVAPRLSRVFVKLQRPIRYLAGYTFAVYLFHYPLLQFFAAATTGMTSPSLRRGIVLGFTLAAVWAAGAVTEQRKSEVRRGLQMAAHWLVRPAKRR